MASFVSASAAVGGTGTLSPSLPSGTTTDDVVVIITATRDSTNTCSTPTDWTLLEQTNNQYVFGRRRDSAWSMPSVTWSGTAAQRTAQAYTIRGLSTTGTLTDILVAEAEYAEASGAGLVIPALTLSSGTDLFLIACLSKKSTADTDGFATSFITDPSGWTSGGAGKGAAGNSVNVALLYQQQSGSGSSISETSVTISPDENPNTNRTGSIFAFTTAATGGHTKFSGKLGYPLRGKLG